jgi:hypothetical protein
MTSFHTKHRSACFVWLFALTLVTANAAWPAPIAAGEELEIWQAMAGIVAQDNAERPYKLWYFQSDFAAASFIASAMTDPERKDFCGLSHSDVQEMLTELKSVSGSPIALDSSVAKSAGFKIAYRKNPRMRYFALSRVIFDPKREHAWLAVELNGVRGHVVRMDKVGSQWNRTSRCGAWYMPEQ